MATDAVLPPMFDSPIRSGSAATAALQLSWTIDSLELQGEAVQLRVGWSELASVQVSRSVERRRRWWGGDRVTHRVHAELRTRQGMRVRLSSVVPQAARLDGLPWMEGAGIEIPEEALTRLVSTAQHAGVKLVEWGAEALEPPSEELQRRREHAEQAERASAKRRAAAEKAAAKEARARERRGRSAKAVGEEEGKSSGWPIAWLIAVILLFMLGAHTCTQLSLHVGLDSIKTFVAIPGDDERLVVIGENELDEQTGTRLFVLDLRSGETITSAVWHAGFFGTQRATVLGELDGLLWLCGGHGEVEGWDLLTLEPRVLLMERAEGDAALRDGGLFDPEWMSCESNRLRVNGTQIEYHTNKDTWVSLYSGKSGGVLPSCASPRASWASLDGSKQRAVQWNARDRPGLSLKEGPAGPVRSLKHAPHVGGAVLMDTLTCNAAQAPGPASVFLLWRDRLDRPMDQLSRVPLKGERGELWSVTAPIAEAPAHLSARVGKLLLLGRQRDDAEVVALDVKTGAVRWRWEP